MPRRLVSLRGQLLGLSLLAMLPLIGLAVYTSFQWYAEAGQQARSETLRLARLITEQDGLAMADTRQLLAILSRIHDLQGRRAGDCQSMIQDLAGYDPDYSDIFVAGPDGEIWCAAQPAPAAASVAGQPWFQQLAAARTLTLGTYEVDPQRQTISLVVAAPLQADTGAWAGAVVVRLNLNWLQQFFQTAALPPGATILVMDAAGTLLARYPPDAALLSRASSEHDLVQALAGLSAARTEQIVGLDGVERLYALQPAAPAGTGLRVAVGVPVATVFSTAGRLLWISGLGLAAAVALALGASIYVARMSIVQPAQALVVQAQRVAAGDLAARSEVAQPGELSALSTALNQMTAILAERAAERERALAALTESEARYRLLFEQAGDGLFLWDAAGRCLAVNAAGARLTGYTQAELLAKPLADLVDAADLERAPLTREAPPPNDLSIRDWRWRHKDGTLLTVEINIAVLPEGRWLGILREVSARRQLEAALRSAEAFLAALMEQLPASILVVDRDQRATLVNYSWETTFRWKRAEVLGRLAAEFLPPAVWMEFAAAWERVLATQQAAAYQAALEGADGVRHLQIIVYPLFDAAGQVTAVASIALEVTETVRALTALRASEERFRLVSELTSDFAFALKLDAAGQPAWEWTMGALPVITGYPLEVFETAAGWQRAIHPDDRAAVRAFYQTCLVRGQAGAQEFRLITAGGSVRYLAVYLRPVQDEHGQIQRLLGSGQDITARRQAETALHLTQFSVDHAADAILWLAADGRLLIANQAAGTLTGYAPGELLTLTISDLVPALTPDLWALRWALLRQAQAATFTDEHRRQDGQRLAVEFTANYLEFDGQVYACLFMRDISVRRRAAAEKDALVSVSRLFLQSEPLDVIYPAVPRLLAETLGFPIATIEAYDAAAGTLTFRGVAGLPADLPSAPADQVLSGRVARSGQPLCELHASERPEQQFAPFRALAVRTFLGAPIWSGGRVWGALTLRDPAVRAEAPALLDVLGVIAAHLGQELERQQAQADLARSEARLREVLEKVQLAAVTLDLAGRVTFCNDFLLVLLGWRREELLGQDWFARCVPPELNVRVIFLESLRTGELPAYFENEVLTRSGERRLIAFNNTVLRDRAGSVIGTTSLGEDITDRRQAEAAVRRLNAELEQRVAERTLRLETINKELEAFSYSVSHDLRAPLRAVNGFATILVDRHGAGLDEEGRRYLGNIQQAGERMSRLIDDLLAYSRLGRRAVRPRPVPLTEVLAEVLRELEWRASQAGAEVRLEPDLPLVMAEPGLLLQIFSNLLENALIYRRPETPPRVAIASRRERESVVVAVADNGLGIRPEYQTQIFEMFQRLHSDDEFPGTGLGLAIVRKAAGLLGGEVWVESVEGSGSTFFIRLPADTAAAAEPPRP